MNKYGLFLKAKGLTPLCLHIIGGYFMAKVYFNYGTMNSRKSAEILMIKHKYESCDKKVILVKPKLDTRDNRVIKSRAFSESAKVDILLSNTDVDKIYKIVSEEKPNAVIVDEVQFLTIKQVEELFSIADNLDIPVITYGLMTDFKTEMFLASKRLVELGAKLSEIKSVCAYCDTKAVFNMRLNEDGFPVFDGKQIEVGYHYESVCRKCYNSLKKIFYKK